ncbi:MAG: Ig-like domain-containing protein [Candidatus Cyclobacteriaceae bacterium M2_1C_046]
MRLLTSLIILGIIYSCANQTSPTGGPKDETPPVLMESIPMDQAINFKGNEIILTFDEHIRLDNPNQQIIITPRLDQDITYNTRRNKLVINFSKPLADNTTYSFNFRESIKDITEGNVADFDYAFSTGPYLDSLNLTGNVKNILKNNFLEGATVGLQLPTDTAAYFSFPPFYFTQTDKSGNFSFKNLKQANYKLYAFNDRNKDLIVQPSLEQHGFIKDLVNLTHDTTGFEIPAVNINLDTLKIISARQAGKYYNINFNKPLIEYNVTPTTRALPYILGDDKKTLTFFNIDQLAGPVNFNVMAEDSVHYTINEQVSIEYTETPRGPIEFKSNLSAVNIVKSNPVINTSISFNKPITAVNYDSIFYLHDSATVFNINKENLTWDSSRSLLKVEYNLPKQIFSTEQPVSNVKPKLYFGKNAFISVEQDSSAKIETTPKFYEENQLGTILVTAGSDYENFIVELLDKNYNIIERRYNETDIRFRNLLPQDYFLRIIGDRNNNEFWDAGNIYLNVIPEPIEYYINMNGKSTIPLRANFEIGPHELYLFDVENRVD